MLEEKHQKRLIERARRGHRDAFDELFSSVRERLLATIHRQMGPTVSQGIDPEDIVQETFLAALSTIETFEWQGRGSFRRWIFGIATRRVLDAGRKQAKRRALRIEQDVPGNGVSPSRGLRRDERFHRLRKCIESLSPDYQTVLRLSRLQGLPIQEVAERMDRSQGAAKSLLLRATRALRESFGETESLHLGGRHLHDGEEEDGH